MDRTLSIPDHMRKERQIKYNGNCMVKLDYLPYVISMISDDIIIIIILLYYWLNIFCYQIFLRLYYYNDFNYNYGNSGELLVGYHISNSQYSHTHVLSFIYCLL